MATTPNGIRYPDDPDEYADIIKFFRELAEDVDTKFVPASNPGGAVMGSQLRASWFEASVGGSTQNSYVLRSNPNGGYDFFDDNLDADGAGGRRLWISGPSGSDVAIQPREGGAAFRKMRMKATSIELDGEVVITGGLNVIGTSTKRYKMETNKTLVRTAETAWQALDGEYAGTTFVAPPSGSVQIGFGGMLPARNKQVTFTYELREGGVIGAGNVVIQQTPWPGEPQPPPHGISTNGMSNENGQWVSVYTAYFKQNLMPGATYNIRPFYVNANTETVTIYRLYFIIEPDL